LIFCRTRIDTQHIAEMLMKDGYNADSLHGDLNQQQRDRVMIKFRQRSLQILVATDVAARGIDVDDITHVIHLNMPDEMEFYTHRSGRTARAGKKGVSIAMITKREVGKIRQLEKQLRSTFKPIRIPTGEQVCQRQLLSLMHKVREVNVNEDEMATFLPAVIHELESLTKQELIKRFAALEFNRFLDYYRDAPDLNVEWREGDDGERSINGDRFFVNIGKMDGVDKAKMLEIIDSSCNVGKKHIGKIDIKGAYSFFEVEKSRSQDVLKGLTGITVKGRKVRVEQTETRQSSSREESRGKSSRPRTTSSRGSYEGNRGGRRR
jgi:ATP-dependent RNA helicase DeaD